MYIRLQYIEFSSGTPLGVDKFQTEGLLRTTGFEDELHEIGGLEFKRTKQSRCWIALWSHRGLGPIHAR